MEIEGVEFLGVTIKFNCPIERHLYDLGSVHLECEGRKFIVDVCQSYTNEASDEIECDVEVDTDTFPVDEDCMYDLTVEDLFVNKTTGTLYIGCEYEVEPDSITLFVKYGGMTKAIELEKN
jgi:hypothetical protein